MTASMDLKTVSDVASTTWNDELIAELSDYIAIPALSPAFDPDWDDNGYLRNAVDHVHSWIKKQPVVGLTSWIAELPERTPVVVAVIPAFGDSSDSKTVLLYGHCDKQPEMAGWEPDLGPWRPVLRDGRLYGRGGADDGYAAYASLTAIRAVQEAGGSHPRCVLLIEASEESGSPDLPAHVAALAETLGAVELVVCLDSGCGDYETLWLTSSLRGMLAATVTVDVLTEGVHSGGASGVVPSSFRLLRQLLDRIEDAETGAVLLPSANTETPDYRLREAEAMAQYLGPREEPYPFLDGVHPMATGVDGLLNRTWRPTVSYVGAAGMPLPNDAGNVLRPSTTLKLSLRLPPNADAPAVLNELTEALTTDPPSGARVTLSDVEQATGWNAPDLAPWLRSSLESGSQNAFGSSLQLMGEGGSIPFMGMLGDRFPDSQFAVMGVLGPQSNAHGPNEFLHLDYARKLTTALASLLNDAAARLT
jgi:acetylornithine deacetylase/succinyl-diaminopimelate desuccinylase-like protein